MGALPSVVRPPASPLAARARRRARRRAVRPLAVLAAIASLLAACGTGAPEHVRIGLAVPLSGPRAALGQQVLDGARLAVEDLDRDGGLLGHDVELVVVDDADLLRLPAQLASLAERSRVTAVIGPEVPGVVLGPRSPLTRRGVPALLPTAFTGDLDDASTHVARLVPSAHDQGTALGRWLREVRGIDRAAVLVADDLEGEAARIELTDALAGAGVEVAAVRSADPGAARLDPVLERLRSEAGDAGAVLLWGPPEVAARATLAVRRLGWDVQVAVGSSAFVADYRSLAGQASEGVVLPFPYRPEWFGPRLTSLMIRYHAERPLGVLPGLDTLVLDVPVLALAAYDAVLTVGAAVEAAGTREPAAVAEAMARAAVDGVLTDYTGAREAWDAEDLHVARFHRFATVFDVDPRLDTDQQREFWRQQVTADYLPDEIRSGPAGVLLDRLLAERRDDVPTYAPPLPPPGPVGRP